MTNFNKIARLLSEPFPVFWHEVKPGAGGGNGQVLVLPFVPWHHYQARLDRVVGWQNWGVNYRFLDQETVYAELTILGVTKGDCGEVEDEEGQATQQGKRRGANPLFGGVAQAFRRACAVFGLGRYLYELDRYYGTVSNKRIDEKAEDIVLKLLQRNGLDPYVRYRRYIGEATNLSELEEVGELIAGAKKDRDLSEKEIKELKGLYGEKLSKFAAGGGSVVPSSSTPTQAPPATQPPPTTPPAFSATSAEVTQEEARISKAIKERSIDPAVQQQIRRSIDNAAKQSLITAPGAMRLLDAFKKTFPEYGKATPKPPAPAPLRPAGTAMGSADYDKAEEKARGATTEEREASYSKEIEGANAKLLDAISGELQTDRLLVSSAIVRLKKKIEKRRQALPPSAEEAADLQKRIATAPTLSTTRPASSPPPPAYQPPAAALGWANKTRSTRSIIELETVIGDSARAGDLTMRDLDWLEPIMNEQKAKLKEQEAEQNKNQGALL